MHSGNAGLCVRHADWSRQPTGLSSLQKPPGSETSLPLVLENPEAAHNDAWVWAHEDRQLFGRSGYGRWCADACQATRHMQHQQLCCLWPG